MNPIEAILLENSRFLMQEITSLDSRVRTYKSELAQIELTERYLKGIHSINRLLFEGIQLDKKGKPVKEQGDLKINIKYTKYGDRTIMKVHLDKTRLLGSGQVSGKYNSQKCAELLSQVRTDVEKKQLKAPFIGQHVEQIDLDVAKKRLGELTSQNTRQLELAGLMALGRAVNGFKVSSRATPYGYTVYEISGLPGDQDTHSVWLAKDVWTIRLSAMTACKGVEYPFDRLSVLVSTINASTLSELESKIKTLVRAEAKRAEIAAEKMLDEMAKS